MPLASPRRWHSLLRVPGGAYARRVRCEGAHSSARLRPARHVLPPLVGQGHAAVHRCGPPRAAASAVCVTMRRSQGWSASTWACASPSAGPSCTPAPRPERWSPSPATACSEPRCRCAQLPPPIAAYQSVTLAAAGRAQRGAGAAARPGRGLRCRCGLSTHVCGELSDSALSPTRRRRRHCAALHAARRPVACGRCAAKPRAGSPRSPPTDLARS